MRFLPQYHQPSLSPSMWPFNELSDSYLSTRSPSVCNLALLCLSFFVEKFLN